MMKMASLLCEGVSQLTGGRSACFWVSFRKLAVTLLCVEVIFTVTTVNLSVTLWQRPRKRRNDLYCPPDEQHTVINSLMPQHERTRWDHWKEIQWKTYEHVIWLNSDMNKHKDSIPTDDSLRDEMDFLWYLRFLYGIMLKSVFIFSILHGIDLWFWWRFIHSCVDMQWIDFVYTFVWSITGHELCLNLVFNLDLMSSTMWKLINLFWRDSQRQHVNEGR